MRLKGVGGRGEDEVIRGWGGDEIEGGGEGKMRLKGGDEVEGGGGGGDEVEGGR